MLYNNFITSRSNWQFLSFDQSYIAQFIPFISQRTRLTQSSSLDLTNKSRISSRSLRMGSPTFLPFPRSITCSKIFTLFVYFSLRHFFSPQNFGGVTKSIFGKRVILTHAFVLRAKAINAVWYGSNFRVPKAKWLLRWRCRPVIWCCIYLSIYLSIVYWLWRKHAFVCENLNRA